MSVTELRHAHGRLDQSRLAELVSILHQRLQARTDQISALQCADAGAMPAATRQRALASAYSAAAELEATLLRIADRTCAADASCNSRGEG